jgi:hypothetical protein
MSLCWPYQSVNTASFKSALALHDIPPFISAGCALPPSHQIAFGKSPQQGRLLVCPPGCGSHALREHPDKDWIDLLDTALTALDLCGK